MILNIPEYEINYCYDMGVDCELNGANTTNCHFAIFATKEKMQAWERGKRDARENKSNQKRIPDDRT